MTEGEPLPSDAAAQAAGASPLVEAPASPTNIDKPIAELSMVMINERDIPIRSVSVTMLHRVITYYQDLASTRSKKFDVSSEDGRHTVQVVGFKKTSDMTAVEKLTLTAHDPDANVITVNCDFTGGDNSPQGEGENTRNDSASPVITISRTLGIFRPRKQTIELSILPTVIPSDENSNPDTLEEIASVSLTGIAGEDAQELLDDLIASLFSPLPPALTEEEQAETQAAVEREALIQGINMSANILLQTTRDLDSAKTYLRDVRDSIIDWVGHDVEIRDDYPTPYRILPSKNFPYGGILTIHRIFRQNRIVYAMYTPGEPVRLMSCNFDSNSQSITIDTILDGVYFTDELYKRDGRDKKGNVIAGTWVIKNEDSRYTPELADTLSRFVEAVEHRGENVDHKFRPEVNTRGLLTVMNGETDAMIHTKLVSRFYNILTRYRQTASSRSETPYDDEHGVRVSFEKKSEMPHQGEVTWVGLTISDDTGTGHEISISCDFKVGDALVEDVKQAGRTYSASSVITISRRLGEEDEAVDQVIKLSMLPAFDPSGELNDSGDKDRFAFASLNGIDGEATVKFLNELLDLLGEPQSTTTPKPRRGGPLDLDGLFAKTAHILNPQQPAAEPAPDEKAQANPASTDDPEAE